MAMTVAHGRVLLSSSYCLKGYMKRAEAQPLSNPRCLRRFMISHMDIDMIKEEKAMLPGGDLRLKGNAWLRAAWTEAKFPEFPEKQSSERSFRIWHLTTNFVPQLML